MGYLYIMETQYKVDKAFQQFLKNMLLEKYPMFLDVHVTHNRNPLRYECYEVFLIIFEKDFRDIENSVAREIKEYIKNLAKYMDIRICGVFNEMVTDEEWEEMKNDKKD